MIVSLGTKSLAQCRPHCRAAEEMRQLFWQGDSGDDGAWLSPDLARRCMEQCFPPRLPGFQTQWSDVRFDTLDCRRFHGEFEQAGHVGLHPTAQHEYLTMARNSEALATLCYHLTGGSLELSPCIVDVNSDRLQRVVVTYCSSGEHRSVAFAALVGELLRQQGVQVPRIQPSTELSYHLLLIILVVGRLSISVFKQRHARFLFSSSVLRWIVGIARWSWSTCAKGCGLSAAVADAISARASQRMRTWQFSARLCSVLGMPSVTQVGGRKFVQGVGSSRMIHDGQE